MQSRCVSAPEITRRLSTKKQTSDRSRNGRPAGPALHLSLVHRLTRSGGRNQAKLKCVMSALFSHAVHWEFCSHNPISSGFPLLRDPRVAAALPVRSVGRRCPARAFLADVRCCSGPQVSDIAALGCAPSERGENRRGGALAAGDPPTKPVGDKAVTRGGCLD